MKLKLAVAAVVLIAGAAIAYAVSILPRLSLPESPTLAIAEVLRPYGTPKGMIFLLSGADGYGWQDAVTARRLVLAGSLVIAIDTPATLAKGEGGDEDCTYFVSDIEQASQDLQRSLDLTRYLSPVIAGSGLGGTFALALAAQSPDATIEHTIAVDPGVVLPMRKELCSEAAHTRSPDGNGWTYALQKAPLPDPIDIYLSAVADPEGRAHAEALKAEGFAISIEKAAGSAEEALRRAVKATLKPASDADNPLADLPITPVPAKATHDTLAIILSGDGGWRDIDAQIGGILASKGVPVVGVDSLRYFWHERTPQETAADLARIAAAYTAKWHVHKVALIGYSFGADVLPAVYASLPADVKSSVSLLSLLAYSGERLFEIEVSGILGAGPDLEGPSTIPDLERGAPPAIVQCVYGLDDKESACTRVHLEGAQILGFPGGHHFDNVYEPVAEAIFDRIAG